jgi:hypothetical protein
MNVPALRGGPASKAANARAGVPGKPAIRAVILAATGAANAAKPDRLARKTAATTRPR